MPSARATRGLEGALFLGLAAPLLVEWFATTSASSRLSYALLVPALALVLALRSNSESPEPAPGRLPGTARLQPGSSSLLPDEKQSQAGAWRSQGGSAALSAGLAALALLGGSLSGVFTLSLLAVPLAAVAYVARWAGRPGLRRLAPALAFLFLMVPPPMPLMDRINPLLTAASGQTAVTLLAPFDAHADWAGSTLTFRGWTLLVAEVCSGSGTLLMLGTLCAFLAALFRLRAAGTVGLLLSSFPLTLLVNGVRIASSALVIDRFGAAAGEGLAHELLGQAVVIVGAALVVLAVERAARTATRESCGPQRT